MSTFPIRLRRLTAPTTALLAALALGAASSAVAAPTSNTAGQSTTSLRDASTVSPQSLAQMIAGPNATVTNASVSGKDVQIGTVKGLPGDGNAITEGVALSTGSLIDPDPAADSDVDFTRSAVLGPNDALDTTGDFGVVEDPASLAQVSGTDVYDEAVLEFDVTATSSNVVLYYSLGSEEYAGATEGTPASWQSRGYKDPLSIQVNGTECAYVPGSQTAVSASTVNESSNADYYTANVSGHTPGKIPVEFNGYTSALPCQAAVTPGQTVHVRVAIADAQDGQLDSTVLLRTQGLGFTDKQIAEPCTAKAGTRGGQYRQKRSCRAGQAGRRRLRRRHAHLGDQERRGRPAPDRYPGAGRGDRRPAAPGRRWYGAHAAPASPDRFRGGLRSWDCREASGRGRVKVFFSRPRPMPHALPRRR